MKIPFRENHLFKILHSFEATGLPLDGFLRNYFRANKAVGAKDRKFICDAIYEMIRWRGLLDHLSSSPPTWEKRYQAYQKFTPPCTDPALAPHIRVSFPKSFYQLLEKSYGEETALSICLSSNTAAPTTVRVNALKTTREKLLKQWEAQYSLSATPHSEWGIQFNKKINFFELPEFKEGLFEVQDEGSQIVANLVRAKEGDEVLDFCAGSGGKTLAFAPKMHGKGQIYLHDIRPFILAEAKKRLRRAGIQNAQVLQSHDPKKPRLKNRMNWVLCDVPCSGSGTIRRNPDMKWKFTLEMMDRIVEEQRDIFDQAVQYLNPKGKIVYATCSIFPEENEEQIAYFQEKYNLELVEKPFRSFPQNGGMDGFFGAILQKRRSG